MSIIVVLDDGICEELLPYPCVHEHLSVSNGTVVPDNEKPVNTLTHGTRCACVITGELSSVSIISIRLMNFGEKTSIENLICALKWCIVRLPSIIHMSLGSVLYDDGQRLLPYIQTLTAAGVLLVSAFNNLQIPTWPACCSGVFGVRSDKSGLLQEGELLFDTKYRGYPENSIIVHRRTTGHKETSSLANSFAAPVITAKLYALLQSRSNVTFSDALEYLQSISVKGVTDSPKFCDLKIFEGKELEIPAVWVCPSLLTQAAKSFRAQEYNVFDCSDFGEGIPLDLYVNDGVITRDLLRMVEIIYDPDIIFMGAVTPPEEPNLFDLYVSIQEGNICIRSSESSQKYSDTNDAFSYIQKFFE